MSISQVLRRGVSRTPDGGTDSASSPGVTRAMRFAPLVVAVLYAVLQTAGYSGMDFSNDSYRYARSALQFVGESRSDAEIDAVKAYCTNRTLLAQGRADVDPTHYDEPSKQAQQYQSCVKNHPDGLKPDDPRYERIFDTRPGYPLATAPAVGALGVLPGMWITDLLITLLGSLLAWAFLRAIGASRLAALGAQVFYLASPISYWSMRPLSEGLVSDAALGAMLGAWWLYKARSKTGTALLLGSFVVLSLTKYSTALLLAAGFGAASMALIVFNRIRTRGVVLLTVLSFGVAAGNVAVAKVASLPSTSTTLQDTFTNHFQQPDVADPWHRLLELNVRYWPHWVVTQSVTPLFLAAAVVGGWAVVRRASPLVGWLCLAVAVVGLGSAVAHPVTDQVERLWLLAWIPAVLGTVLWLDTLRPAANAGREDVTAPVPVTVGKT